MIEGRTHVKFLRRLGVALILSPEFITTPFGVALILVARYLSKRREASQNNRLREMVEYYLARNGGFSSYADGQSSVLGSVKRHTQSEERLIPQQYTGSLSFEANLAPSVWQNWCDMRGRTVHHTMDMQSFSGRYEGAGSAVAHSNWARTSGAGERVTHHSLNMILLSQRHNTGSVGQAKVKHHNINMAPLRQRYGSAVSSTRVLNALRNNNFYYDIASRGNVIGGY